VIKPFCWYQKNSSNKLFLGDEKIEEGCVDCVEKNGVAIEIGVNPSNKPVATEVPT
jgi:hypothetical protein